MRVMTFGTFDLFHEGHVNFLCNCYCLINKEGEENPDNKVIVGLNIDSFVKRYKGESPICSYEERELVLRSCQYVGGILPNDNKEIVTVLLENNIDILAIGSDWAKKDYYAQIGTTQKELDQYNISLVYLPYTEGISSTIIKKRICNQK